MVGPIEPATKRGHATVLALSRFFNGDPGGEAVDFTNVVLKPIMRQGDRRRAEGVSFDNVGAGREKAAMQLMDLIGTGAHQILIAALELSAAEIGRT